MILRKKNGAGAIRLPDFRLYYESIAVKTLSATKTEIQINGIG